MEPNIACGSPNFAGRGEKSCPNPKPRIPYFQDTDHSDVLEESEREEHKELLTSFMTRFNLSADTFQDIGDVSFNHFKAHVEREIRNSMQAKVKTPTSKLKRPGNTTFPSESATLVPTTRKPGQTLRPFSPKQLLTGMRIHRAKP
jgi:hypothetical protein